MGGGLVAPPRNLTVAAALTLLIFPIPTFLGVAASDAEALPVVVSTWPFVEAVRAAWKAVDAGLPAIDAVVDGCSACEELRCDGTVGPGGSPDENGETTLDALIMNGTTMEVGAIAAMRYVKDGIKAAKNVMEHTEHTLLAGEQASVFAISMGLPGPSNLSSPESLERWSKWKEQSCQPNFWKDVFPANGCGPYRPKEMVVELCNPSSKGRYMEGISSDDMVSRSSQFSRKNHDTISMAVIDKELEVSWRSAVATLIGFVGLVCGTVGGGGIFVPMLNLIVGFNTKSTAALLKCMIMGASMSLGFLTRPRTYPSYDLALLFQPMLMLGITIGVSLSVVFPYWLIIVLIIILFLSIICSIKLKSLSFPVIL